MFRLLKTQVIFTSLTFSFSSFRNWTNKYILWNCNVLDSCNEIYIWILYLLEPLCHSHLLSSMCSAQHCITQFPNTSYFLLFGVLLNYIVYTMTILHAKTFCLKYSFSFVFCFCCLFTIHLIVHHRALHNNFGNFTVLFATKHFSSLNDLQK